ncbi:VOC family protein [Methylobacterium sp. WL120]|uniref:VOC family protein n=1 Tax=Methylobacterium sp. WL120 TaxID=2603887 RepID=UPI0011C7A0B1|nr:VOC family protein [Methylobacterium sp. WL120]TXM67974.1 VOC family protein [Methylobacterium sp. WL120]
MLTLDHLVIVAPDLAAGVAYVRDGLGIDMPEGGRHREMGTRNHLLRLGPATFLEVIAIDDRAVHPGRPRWFGLDDRDRVRADWEAGRRLRGWVARTDDLDRLLRRHPGLFGDALAVSRGALTWRFAVRPDGAWPEDGALPCPMTWGDGPHPAAAMPDLGCRLAGLTLTHPDPDRIAALYRTLDLADAPTVRAGAFGYRAEIATPGGLRVLS